MRCILAIAFAVVAVLAVAEGKVLPASDVENQQTGNQTPQLTDLIRDAQTAINSWSTQIQEKLNLPNQDEFVNVIKEHSNTLATNVQQYVHNMTEQVKNKNPELENLWTNMKTKLNEMIDKVSVNPETTEQINQLHTRLQEGIQTLITETENAAKSIGENSNKLQEDIANLAKGALDIAKEATQNLNNQLHQVEPQA